MITGEYDEKMVSKEIIEYLEENKGNLGCQ